MKIKFNILLFSIFILIGNITFAQAPEGVNYQAVLRNITTGTVIPNGSVNVQIKIITGTATGTVIYQEIHPGLLTNQGLVNLVIGKGLPQTGTFASIPWSTGGNLFVNTAIQVGGTGTYQDYGTQQLMSVPFALYSKYSGNQLNQWLYGNTTPTSGLGDLGDFYLDLITGNVNYKNTATTWQFIGNIKGQQGIQGLQGPQGTNGMPGIINNGTLTGNTTFWNGSQWVVDNNNLYNNSNGVGIGTSSPDLSAKLDVSSTTKGFLPPRMTSIQRDAIVSPAVGLVIFNISSNCLNFFNGVNWKQNCGTNMTPIGAISALICSSSNSNGSLFVGLAANGVSNNILYVGGNSGTYNGQTISSTGVTGLTATISSGIFNNGSGSLTIQITGVPNSVGTATFAINIGGQNCVISRSVIDVPVYPTGSVFCSSGPTSIVNVVTLTGKTWMDRNLGASQLPINSNDTLAMGDLYQWGRASDGHQCRNSLTTSVLSSTNQPGHSLFIICDGNYNWRSPENNTLWQGVNGVNNPCPTGYRIPTKVEFTSEASTWIQNNEYGAYSSPLKLIIAGYRSVNGIIYPTNGVYNSSTYIPLGGVNNTYITPLNVITSTYVSAKGNGCSVRCIKN
jgi:hypothetical protein